ncbi:MAG: hypothetical protein KatS3mg023_3869 [Armatimonadota bacterium]|nr:MAG: hypothetical protein KatS3mg023_3869 [Armatimonadota bacterium]
MKVASSSTIDAFTYKYFQPFLTNGDYEDMYLYLLAYRKDGKESRTKLILMNDMFQYDLEYWLEELEDGYNVAFGIMPRKEVDGQVSRNIPKHAEDDHYSYYLVVDIDNTYLKDEQLELIQETGPAWIIASGGGYHVYYYVESITAAEFREYQKELIALYKTRFPTVDTKIHDPSRVMRLPGTYNPQRERNGEPVACRILYEEDVYPESAEDVIQTVREVFCREDPDDTNREEVSAVPVHLEEERHPPVEMCGKKGSEPKSLCIEFACRESYEYWIQHHHVLRKVPVEIVENTAEYSTGTENANLIRLYVNVKSIPFAKRYLGGVRFYRCTYRPDAPQMEPKDVYDDSLLNLEVELSTAFALRARDARCALVLPYLHQLKREGYKHGVIPTARIVEYIQNHVRSSRGNPVDRSVVYKILRRLQTLGLVTATDSGYIVHSLKRQVQQLNPKTAPIVVRIRKEDWQDLKSMKRILALIPALYRQPKQKRTIAEILHVHPTTVKRNRKGTARAWTKEYLPARQSYEQAVEDGYQNFHRGFRPKPEKTANGYSAWRFSAAKALALLCWKVYGKTKHLRRSFQQRHAFREGNGAGAQLCQQTMTATTALYTIQHSTGLYYA